MPSVRIVQGKPPVVAVGVWLLQAANRTVIVTGGKLVKTENARAAVVSALASVWETLSVRIVRAKRPVVAVSVWLLLQVANRIAIANRGRLVGMGNAYLKISVQGSVFRVPSVRIVQGKPPVAVVSV